MFAYLPNVLVLLPLLVRAGEEGANQGEGEFPVFKGDQVGAGEGKAPEEVTTWGGEGTDAGSPEGGDGHGDPGQQGDDVDKGANGGLNIFHKPTEGYCVVAQSQQPDAPVVLMPCADPATSEGSQLWQMPQPGQTGLVRWGDTFCLDAGLEPHDGGPSKLWECDESNEWIQQQWKVKDDGLLETGNGQCLNVRRDSVGEVREMQTWSCDPEDPQNREYCMRCWAFDRWRLMWQSSRSASLAVSHTARRKDTKVVSGHSR
jgi:hypothetical protein